VFTVSNNKPQAIVEYINSLSILEKQTSMLYKDISFKVENPLVKTLLGEIALDSQKHSLILSGISESITGKKVTEKEYSKSNEILKTMAKIQKEIAKIEKIGLGDFKQLSDKLQFLEGEMGEEYYTLAQMKTLEMMTKEINKLYSIDLGNLKSIFIHVINDEEHHREILQTIKQLTANKEEDQKVHLHKNI
jgi:rubrerythrin